MKSWLAIALVLVASRGLLAATNLVHRSCAIHPESARKLLHVAMGLTLAACPWIFGASAWPVLVLCAIFIGLLAARCYSPSLHCHVADVVYGVERRSRGELYFPIAVAALALVARGRPLFFTVPVLVLALADTAAAVVGS